MWFGSHWCWTGGFELLDARRVISHKKRGENTLTTASVTSYTIKTLFIILYKRKKLEMKVSILCHAVLFVLALAPTTHAAPSPCPSDTSIIGYSNWYALEHDVQAGDGVDQTLIVCPGSFFDLNDETVDGWDLSTWIAINGDSSPVTIQCGLDGAMENDCVIWGGLHHFALYEKASGVVFKGLTFQRAAQTSIISNCKCETWGCSDIDATFVDCLWLENGSTDSRCEEGYCQCAAAISGSRGVLSFERCSFLDNEAPLGAVFNRYGSMSFNQCKFERNKSQVSSKTNGGGGKSLFVVAF